MGKGSLLLEPVSTYILTLATQFKLCTASNLKLLGPETNIYLAQWV